MIGLDHDHPDPAGVLANMQVFANYAVLCQEAGMVSIVEPDMLIAGSHTIERCRSVTGDVLLALFDELNVQGVALEGVACPSLTRVGFYSSPSSGFRTSCLGQSIAGGWAVSVLFGSLGASLSRL